MQFVFSLHENFFFFRSLKMELLENFSNEDFQETSTYCFVFSQYKVIFFPGPICLTPSFVCDVCLRNFIH